MKAKKARDHTLLIVISIISLFGFIYPVFSQEGDAPMTAWKWYYYQRAYPFDSIPFGSYENAIAQRDALLQSTGYQYPAPLIWKQIGPLPYAGTYSGRIAHVVYDPLDPAEDGTGRVIYVTGASGGLWKTIDGGDTWLNRSGSPPNDLPTLSAGAFTISYVNGNKILYFGSGQWNQFWGDGMGMRILKSTDDGFTWTQIGNGLRPGTSISKIAVKPNDPNTMFAATFHGLYKTINGGNNWTKIIPRPSDPIQELICSDVCFSPSGNRVYAVGPNQGRTWPWNVFDGIGYWRSDDGGNSFNPITNAGWPHSNVVTGGPVCAVSKAPGAEDIVWFLSFDDDDPAVNYVYKSENHGDLFTSRVVGNSFATKYHLVLRASDVNPDICYAGNMNLYRTSDPNINIWDWVDGYGGTHADFHGFDINPFDPQKVTAGNDGGVFRSDNSGDPGSWYSRNQYLGSLSLLWGLASSTYDAGFVAGGLHDFTTFCYNPDAGPLSPYWNIGTGGGGDCGGMLSSPFKSKHFIGNILTGNQNVYYSTNGANFFEAADYISSGSTASTEVEPFIYNPVQPGEIYTVRFNGKWRDSAGLQIVNFRKSTDDGVTWGGSSPLREFQRPRLWDATAPSGLAISQSNPNNIIMRFGNGSEYWMGTFDAKSRLIKSTNGGSTWEGIDYGNGPIVTGGSNGTPDRFFTDVEFDPLDSNELYLTVSGYYPPPMVNGGHVFKSIDGGHNWSNISGSLPDIPVNDIMIHYTGTGVYDKELIIATDAGIYHSNATNIGWSEIANAFPKTPALHLDYNRLFGKLRVNTWGRGAWEFQLDNTIYVQDRLYITDNVSLDKQIVVAPGGKLILGHSALMSSFAINFIENSKITVEEGGTLLANTNTPITLTSPGSWPGIEVKGLSSNCVLYNCTFSNTATPVVINGGMSDGIPPVPEYGVVINDCHFSNAPVSVTNRNDVHIQYCDWINNTGQNGIIASGANGLYLLYNEINYTSQVTGSHAIQVSQSDNVAITRSTISHCDYEVTSIL